MILKIVKLKLFNFSAQPSHQDVSSAGDYIILKHLNRNLFELDSDGFVIPDLANSYSVSSDFTVFTIYLKQDQYFSDGSIITAQDFEDSILPILKRKSAVHFDFRLIDNIQIVDTYTIQITLNKPFPRFIDYLVHPEFGIVKYNRRLNNDYPATSGHYRIRELNNSELILAKNENMNQYPFKPEQVVFTCKNQSDIDIEFYNHPHQIQKHQKMIDTGIGFTFWITLNTDKVIFSEFKNRNSVFDLFNKNLRIENSSTIQKTHRLYSNRTLPFSGVIYNTATEHQLNDLSIDVLLLQNHFLNHQIIQILESKFKSVTYDYYENMNEFNTKKLHVDLCMTNNDFSNIDQTQSLNTTFNPNNALINKNQEINDLLNSMNSLSTNDPQLSNIFTQIESCILRNQLIIPLYTRQFPLVVSNHLDIGSWSEKYPEISAWKIKPKN